MSDNGLPSGYYHRRDCGTHAVICPICGGVHVYRTTGTVNCFQHLDAAFNLVAPFSSWQQDQADMAKEAAAEPGV